MGKNITPTPAYAIGSTVMVNDAYPFTGQGMIGTIKESYIHCGEVGYWIQFENSYEPMYEYELDLVK